MAKLVSLPEIIQNIYVKLEESGQGGSGTGGNCSSNITIDTSTNKGTLNISDGSVLSAQVLNVEDTPKAGRVTLTDKDSNSISFDAVTVQYLGKNFYTKSVVDDKLSALVLDSYDDTELKNRVTVLENKVDNDTIYDDTQIQSEINSIKSQLQTISSQGYDDTELKNRVTVLENKVANMVTYGDLTNNAIIHIDIYENIDINQEISKQLPGSPTTTLTVDDINFVEDSRTETTTEITIHYIATVIQEMTFKDGSSSNITIIFAKTIKEKKDSENIYRPLKNGVKIQRTDPNTPAYVDTGLMKNSRYTFIAEGYTTNKKISVLVGSYTSNTDRTTLRILSNSNKIQSMWSANNEITSVESGTDFNSLFKYEQSANYIAISGQVNRFDKLFSNQDYSQTTNTPIYLFNESTTSDYDHGVLSKVNIYETLIDEEGADYGFNLLRVFIPCKDTRTNEIVLIDVAKYKQNPIEDIDVEESYYIEDLKTGNISEENIYRPTNGILVEA